MGWFVFVLVAVVIVAPYIWYALIVTRRNRVSEALAGVDVQLQQRHDLIPNVLTTARRFMEHERALFDGITELRNKAHTTAGSRDFATAGERFEIERQIDTGMGRLFALAENYPALKSEGPMMEAQRAYSEVEANISAARRFYNSALAELRNITEIFPGTLLKGMAGVTVIPPFFETSEAVRAPVDAARHLGAPDRPA
ncbi:MAG: LemA family protein [Parvibaculaceae bacterium]